MTGVFVLVAVVAAVFAARWPAHRRADEQVRRALVDPDPDVRGAAISVLHGLGRHAGVLLERTRRETDPRVLDALADAIARHQWEPIDRPELVELRLWAQSHHRPSSGAARGAHAPERASTREPDVDPDALAARLAAQLARTLGPGVRSVRVETDEDVFVLERQRQWDQVLEPTWA